MGENNSIVLFFFRRGGIFFFWISRFDVISSIVAHSGTSHMTNSVHSRAISRFGLSEIAETRTSLCTTTVVANKIEEWHCSENSPKKCFSWAIFQLVESCGCLKKKQKNNKPKEEIILRESPRALFFSLGSFRAPLTKVRLACREAALRLPYKPAYSFSPRFRPCESNFSRFHVGYI